MKVKKLESFIKVLKEDNASQLTKNKLDNDQELVNDLEKELDKINKKLDVPDLEKGLDDYRSNPSDYQGLFVKQDSTGKVSFSVKDVANFAETELNTNGADIANKVKNIRIEDEKGKEYKLYPSSSTLYKAKGGLSWDDKNEKTYYQECIQLLLLTNAINYSGDLLEWLKNSDRKKKTNIFEYVEPYRQTKVRDDNLFKQYWNDFVDLYGPAFKLCKEQSNGFISDVNSILKTNGKLVPIHGGIIAPWSDKASVILAGQDKVDKSDGYVVSSKDKSKIDKILSTMIELKKDPVNYVKFMESAPILGISLKKNNGKHIAFDYDEPPIKPNEVKKIYFTTSKSGNQIIFNLEGKETSLDIRSAGGVKVEFRPKGEPAYGNAVTALQRTLGDRYDKFGSLLKERKFRDATRYLIYLLCGEKSPKENTQYTMTKQGMKEFAEIFNFAAGRPIYNDKGERLTTPYMKVH